MESAIQSRIIQELKKMGYIPIKMIKCNLNGIPDLQILLPNGKHLWVEVKDIKGRLSEIQKYRIGQLRQNGDKVLVVYSYEEFLEQFIYTINSMKVVL